MHGLLASPSISTASTCLTRHRHHPASQFKNTAPIVHHPRRSSTLVYSSSSPQPDPSIPEGGNANPLSSQFMGVLQQSLARQGADALTKGIEVNDEFRVSAVEEVLQTALNQSKHTLRILQQWRNKIDAQIAAQEKQVDRMEFALSKARNDGALLKTLKKMVYENDSD